MGRGVVLENRRGPGPMAKKGFLRHLWSKKVVLFYFKDFIYLFGTERVRAHKQGECQREEKQARR